MTKPEGTMTKDTSRFSADDLHWFNEGRHFHLHEKLGAHPMTADGVQGVYFAVWAPNARRVSVFGDFNGWDKTRHVLRSKSPSGVWEGFVAEARVGSIYKFYIESAQHGYKVDKADPFAFRAEVPPRTGSIVATLDYTWNDREWMAGRGGRQNIHAPMSIYEVHLGSWMRVPEENNRSLGYREIAPKLAEYAVRMGYTHVEFMPIMEHPFGGSWGYQCTGYFAPTARFGSPQDLMFLIDTLHQAGVGVILDWVPSHFPSDEHALAYFDGTHLFEHADPRQGHHPDWHSDIFNYGRHEVRSFLISSAFQWLEHYHADGLRVDAVASMLYLDYSRKEGEWVPNRFGGNENLEAIEFLRNLNEAVYKHFPDVQMIAEDSTAWPMVSRPLYLGGLGFGFKWDMGWMHDTLDYLTKDPVHRKFHHGDLTFRMHYAWTENFVNALSHDEVVHGKGSLLDKMPGDEWQKRANLRLLHAYMYTQPGKKLLFMGGEIGQWREWSHESSLDWHLLEDPRHFGIQRWVQDLNRAYRNEPALYEHDCEPAGFEWVDCNDSAQSTLAFLRKSRSGAPALLAVFNFTPVPRPNYRVGVPEAGFWAEILNSDAREYGGSGQGNLGGCETSPVGEHGRPYSLTVTLPPLSALVFRGPQPEHDAA